MLMDAAILLGLVSRPATVYALGFRLGDDAPFGELVEIEPSAATLKCQRAGASQDVLECGLLFRPIQAPIRAVDWRIEQTHCLRSLRSSTRTRS